jgi:hypothetical protein
MINHILSSIIFQKMQIIFNLLILNDKKIERNGKKSPSGGFFRKSIKKRALPMQGPPE